MANITNLTDFQSAAATLEISPTLVCQIIRMEDHEIRIWWPAENARTMARGLLEQADIADAHPKIIVPGVENGVDLNGV